MPTTMTNSSSVHLLPDATAAKRGAAPAATSSVIRARGQPVSRREHGWEDRPERWGLFSMAGHHVEVHLVILPMAFLLAISATAAKGSFAASQRISGQLVIRATNRPSRRTAGFGCSEGFGMVTTNLASKHI
jgi:hypothetical protein